MKRIIFDFLKYYYRRLLEIKFEISVLVFKRKNDAWCSSVPQNTVYFITTPEYGNIGDHAIAMAMIKYIKHRYHDYRFVEIPDSKFAESFWWIKKYNRSEDIICLIGGGNFGDIYLPAEWNRRLVVKYCRRAKIILFPQSAAWGDSRYSDFQLRRSSLIYLRNEKLFLLAREHRTYKLMKNYFGNRIQLVPDIVFTINYIKPVSKMEKHALLVMRSDVEKNTDCELITEIEKLLRKKGYTIEFFDTETYSKISRDESFEMVNKVLNKFSDAGVVVSDRLHGLIFSQIVGTPSLIFDNSTRKISGVYELWINKDYCRMYEDKKDLELQIDELCNMKKNNYDCRKYIYFFDTFFDCLDKNEGMGKSIDEKIY